MLSCVKHMLFCQCKSAIGGCKFLHIRASIIRGCKQAICCRGGERGGERGEKRAVSLCTGIKKFCETDKWAISQLTIIRVG
jgi:hypothetical protein